MMPSPWWIVVSYLYSSKHISRRLVYRILWRWAWMHMYKHWEKVVIIWHNVLPQFALSVKDLNLPEFRLDFLRIVCSHEHYVVLNLPLGTVLYVPPNGSQQSSPSGSISSTYESLDIPNVEAMGELSYEFRHFHYLSGLVLSELAQVLVDGKWVFINFFSFASKTLPVWMRFISL